MTNIFAEGPETTSQNLFASIAMLNPWIPCVEALSSEWYNPIESHCITLYPPILIAYPLLNHLEMQNDIIVERINLLLIIIHYITLYCIYMCIYIYVISHIYIYIYTRYHIYMIYDILLHHRSIYYISHFHHHRFFVLHGAGETPRASEIRITIRNGWCWNPINNGIKWDL